MCVIFSPRILGLMLIGISNDNSNCLNSGCQNTIPLGGCLVIRRFLFLTDPVKEKYKTKVMFNFMFRDGPFLLPLDQV